MDNSFLSTHLKCWWLLLIKYFVVDYYFVVYIFSAGSYTNMFLWTRHTPSLVSTCPYIYYSYEDHPEDKEKDKKEEKEAVKEGKKEK